MVNECNVCGWVIEDGADLCERCKRNSDKEAEADARREDNAARVQPENVEVWE